MKERLRNRRFVADVDVHGGEDFQNSKNQNGYLISNHVLWSKHKFYSFDADRLRAEAELAVRAKPKPKTSTSIILGFDIVWGESGELTDAEGGSKNRWGLGQRLSENKDQT